ncbi:hypothetical protein DY000_02007827 [Brassica cretica]|uniref:Uncharacterized protein n=1 Tax=Brassica cretica TaxID=69181 RepID=A0ABQ7C2G0_BRACR|nr:hypothetical protein DY000_02007827 [Brassica cretica]
MSAKKSAPKRAAPSETEDEVSPSSSGDPSTVLAYHNTKVFPLNPMSLPEDSLAAIQSVQSDLLHAMSQLFHLGERMDDHASLKADIAALTSQLREEKDSVLAKEKEIKALRPKVRNQDEEPRRGWDVGCIGEYLSEGVIGAPVGGVSGDIMVTRWELMREWLNHQTDNWDLESALERYKVVKTSEAEFQRLPAPSFEGEPMIPSKTQAEKTLEPTVDDPLVD